MRPSSLLHFSLFTFHSSLLAFSLSAGVVDFTPPMTGAHPAENLAMASDALDKVIQENPKAFVAVHPGGDSVADAAFANFCDRRRTFWAPDGVPARCATTDCVSTPWVPEMRCPELICQRLARIARKGDRHFSCVWIGDSITHYWEPTQAKYFPDYDILNLGIAADLTQNVLWRLKYGSELDGYSTDLFMVMIGTNNSEGKPEETANGIKAILDLVREKHPTTPILLCAIFPRGEKATDVRRCTNDKVNEIIKGFANGKDILWLDFRKDFLTADGTLTREVMKDLLHPAPKGYEIWQRNVAPVFARYCKKVKVRGVGGDGGAEPSWPKATVTDADGVISIMPATPGPAVTRGYVLGGVCEAVQNARRAGKPYRLKPNPDCEDVNFDAWPLFQQQNLPLVPCPGSSKWCVWQTTKNLAYLRNLGTNPVETVVFGPSTMGDVATICKTAGVTLDLAKPFFRLGDWNTGLNAMLWFGQYGMLDGYTAKTIVINFPRLNGGQDRAQQEEARRRILKLVREKHPESDVRLVEGGIDSCVVSAAQGVVRPELKTIYVNDFETEEPELVLPMFGAESALELTDTTFCTTTAEHKFGQRALQLERGTIVWTDIFARLGDWRGQVMDKTKVHTVSAWVKAEKPDTYVEIRFSWRPGEKTSYKVGTEWTRITHTGLPAKDKGIELRIPDLKGRFYIDGLKLEEGEVATDFVPGEPARDPRCNGGFKNYDTSKRTMLVGEPPPWADNPVQGPLVRYTMALESDKVLPVRLMLNEKVINGRVARPARPQRADGAGTRDACPYQDRMVCAEISLCDASGKVIWQETKPFVDGRIETAIPLKGLAFGDYTFKAEPNHHCSPSPSTFTSLARTIRVTLAPDGPSVIRADRFRRVMVDKDGVPQIGLIGGCPYDLDDAHAERLMADVRAHGCFVTALRSYGKQMEADRILHMLDLCRKYGLKAQVSWGLCLNDYWCPFCVGDKPSKTHSGGENGRPLDPKKVAVNMEVLRKIRDHPAFFWSHTVDEPTERQLEKSTAVITEQEHVDPHHPHFALLNNAMMMRMFSPLMREVVHLDNYGRADGDVWASARSVAKWADCRPMTYDIHSMAGAMMMPAVTPEQLRNMAYQAIVVGAGIIEPFVYRPWSGKLYAEWTNLAAEMKALTPAIAAEEWLDAPDPGEFGGITWSWRFTPEAAYLITLSVAKGDKPRTIDLPKDWSYATKAEVMFENRTLDAKDGRLADTWSQYDRHVYRFAK